MNLAKSVHNNKSYVQGVQGVQGVLGVLSAQVPGAKEKESLSLWLLRLEKK
jgi:hypothetical protein